MDPVILIFGGIAAFFIFKLFSALGDGSDGQNNNADGKNDFDALRDALTGNARKDDKAKEQGDKKFAQSKNYNDREANEFEHNQTTAPAPGPAPVRAISPAGEKLLAADDNFDELAFIEGAKSAYEMVVEAFADGDISPVKAYLSDNVSQAFQSAIDQRKSANHSAELTFVGIDKANIFEAQISDDKLIAVTDFTSNQVRVTRDADGNSVDGDPNRVDLVKDRWTFSRKRHSDDPNWILVATGGA